MGIGQVIWLHWLKWSLIDVKKHSEKNYDEYIYIFSYKSISYKIIEYVWISYLLCLYSASGRVLDPS